MGDRNELCDYCTDPLGTSRRQCKCAYPQTYCDHTNCLELDAKRGHTCELASVDDYKVGGRFYVPPQHLQQHLQSQRTSTGPGAPAANNQFSTDSPFAKSAAAFAAKTRVTAMEQKGNPFKSTAFSNSAPRNSFQNNSFQNNSSPTPKKPFSNTPRALQQTQAPTLYPDNSFGNFSGTGSTNLFSKGKFGSAESKIPPTKTPAAPPGFKTNRTSYAAGIPSGASNFKEELARMWENGRSLPLSNDKRGLEELAYRLGVTVDEVEFELQLNYWAEPTGTSGNPVNLLPPGFRTTPIRQGVRTQESPFNPETTTLRPPGFRTTPTRQGVQESLFNPATTTLRPPLRYGTRDILASVSAEQAASKRPYDEFLRGEPATHYGGDFDFLNAENRKQVTNARQHDQARQRAEDALDEERRNQEDLRGQVAMLQDHNRKLESRVEEFRRTPRTVTLNVVQLTPAQRTAIDEIPERLNEIKSLYEHIRSGFKHAQSSSQRMSMSNEMAQAIIDSTEAACAMLTSYISELRDTCAALDCNIKSDLDNAMLQFAQVQEERDELRTRLDTALAAQATPDPSAPPADLTDLQKQLSDETASKAKLAKQLRSLTLELQALKSNPGPSNSSDSAEAAKLKEELDRANLQTKSNLDRMNELAKETEQLKGKITALETDLEAAKSSDDKGKGNSKSGKGTARTKKGDQSAGKYNSTA